MLKSPGGRESRGYVDAACTGAASLGGAYIRIHHPLDIMPVICCAPSMDCACGESGRTRHDRERRGGREQYADAI